MPGTYPAFFMDTVEKLINRLPEEQCEFILHVREILLSAHPEVTEKLHFSTAFITLRGWLAYFNPLDSGGLEINFCKGYLLDGEHPELIVPGRKYVRGLVYNTPADFDEATFRTILSKIVALHLQKKKPKAKATKAV